MNFYAKSFNGTIKSLSYFEGSPVEDMATDKKNVLHAHLVAPGMELMASDSGKKESESLSGSKVQLSFTFTDQAEQKKIFDALSDGGKITMPLQDTFWGATFGMLTDKYGVSWMFNYDKPGSND
jgi:PhnB protein